MLGCRLKQPWCLFLIDISDRKQLCAFILVWGGYIDHIQFVQQHPFCFLTYLIHLFDSNIEEGDQILFFGQAQSSADGPAETKYDASFETVCSWDDSNVRRCPCLFIDKHQRNGHFIIWFIFTKHFPMFLFISCLGYLCYLLAGVICLRHKVVTPSDEWFGQKGSETMSSSGEMRPLFNWRSRQNERDGKLKVFTGLCSGFFKLFVINTAAFLLSIAWNSLIS